MSVIDQFELMIHGVQALRRQVELLSCPISGASGVRAQFYPHQVQNVRRVLTSTRIHHLIADEVGMGKTIQALMIANALRLQMGKLRVRIVVPDHNLKTQWIEEIACRAHCTPETGEEPVGEDWFDVFDDSFTHLPSETLEPTKFDLLILDEPQNLKVDTLRFVAANSADFPRVLLLTAAPNLRDMRRFLELLLILEPERLQHARREAETSQEHDQFDWSPSRIGDLEDDALQLVNQKFQAQCALVTDRQIDTSQTPAGVSEKYSSFADHRRIRVVTETRWMYRNVLRSYRTDFPDHLPRRKLKTLVIEPTSDEAERMHLTRDYVGEMLSSNPQQQNREFASALLQRASLGGKSFQDRLGQLRRNGDTPEFHLATISHLTRRETADARLDALVDWLVTFWSTDPTRKVVVAAEGKITIHELHGELQWRIPKVGPRGKRIDLEIVTAIDERPNVDELDEELDTPTLQNLATSQLRKFVESDAQLLLAHHVFRRSFNLQAAEALIFYGLPWNPEDVDQWIGRVDRLGRDCVNPERPLSLPKPVRVVTIHRQDDPTIAVQEVLDEYRIFESALDPDRSLLEEITSCIEERALALPHNDAVAGTTKPVHQVAASGMGNTITPPTGSHWTIERALELHYEVARRSDLGPVLRQTERMGYVTSPSEDALAKWIVLLRNQKFVNIVKFPGQGRADGLRSRTYYTLGQTANVRPRLETTQDQQHRFIPFFIARGNIQRPPRLKVNTAFQGNSPNDEILQFLSFGSPLHTDLVETFSAAGRTLAPLGLRIFALGTRHFPNGTDLTAGTYLCGVGFVDPGECYRELDSHQLLLADLPETTLSLRLTMRDRATANLIAGLEADARFVRTQRKAKLSLLAWLVGTDNVLQCCSAEMAADLLGPHWQRDERPNTEPITIAIPYGQQLVTLARQQIASDMKTNWATNRSHVIERFEERIEVIRIEAEDSLWVLRSAIQEVEAKIANLSAHPTETNTQTIARNYQPQLELLVEELQLVQRARDRRICLLEESLSHINDPQVQGVQLQCTAVIELLPDLVSMPVAGDGQAPTNDDGIATQMPDDSDEQPLPLPNHPR